MTNKSEVSRAEGAGVSPGLAPNRLAGVRADEQRPLREGQLVGDVALVCSDLGRLGVDNVVRSFTRNRTPEGANARRPTMNRFASYSEMSGGNLSESGTFCMEPGTDEVQHRRWLKQLREMPDVRLKKIMRIRAEIANGTYETEAKWRIALERLMNDQASMNGEG